jgi:OOP family OmpA-OmpF porin
LSILRTSASAALAAVALALVVVGCGGGPASPAVAVPTTTVELPKSYTFVPAAIAVTTGATVTWNNADDFTHNVTFEGDEALTMSPGESATRTFTSPGLYPYVCTLHPTEMSGSVTVG